MIAASEPQEFVPRGRQQVAQHPGDVVRAPPQTQLHPDSFLLHRLSQVAITDVRESEWWTVRSSYNGEAQFEEELYVRGKTAVWSRGAASHRGTKVVICCYSNESPLAHALWCSFYTTQHPGTPLPCVCLVDGDSIHVYTGEGEDYVATLQFQVASVWQCKYGVLLERATTATSTPRVGLVSFSEGFGVDGSMLPTIFSLLHPLDEIKPVLAKHGSVSNMSDSGQRLVFTNECPSICMLYNSRTGLHSVWRIRKATSDEQQSLCGSQDSSVILNQSSSVTAAGATSSSSVPSASASDSGRVSLGKASPFASRTNSLSSFQISPVTSRSHSPLPPSWVQSFRTQLPASPSPSSATQSRTRPWLLDSPVSATPPPDSRLMTSQAPDSKLMDAQPLVPELCLEHMWTENLGVPKDGPWGPATRVFLTTDLVGQTYLCYLIQAQNQLLCTRLEKSNNEQQLIFGVVSAIPAKDAASLPQLHMVATVDLTGGVVLYSGMSMVGKVHVAGIPSALATSSYLSHFGSPFPKRSSLLSSTRPVSSMDSVKFDDEVHLLSPVPVARLLLDEEGDCFGRSTPRRGQLAALRDAVDNRVTLEYSDGSLFRISLPELCSSPLVLDCLDVLKHVLQRDLAMQLLVRWYAARNAPGTQDISPGHEWQLFIGVLLELLGYDVDKLGVETDVGDVMGSPCGKKKRASDCGSHEDWDYLLSSSHHRSLAPGLSAMLGLASVPRVPTRAGSALDGKLSTSAPLFTALPLVLFALHLLYEEQKLNMLVAESLPLLAQLLHQLASDLRLYQYQHHYWRDFPTHCPLHTTKESQVSEADVWKLSFPAFLPADPPDVFRHVYQLLCGLEPSPFPYVSHVNRRTRDVVQLTALIARSTLCPRLQLEAFVRPVVPSGNRGEPQTILSARDSARSAGYPFPQRAVLLMVEMGLTRRDLQTLPAGIALMLNVIIYRCRLHPPTDWPEAAYRLVLRQDLAALCRQPKPTPGEVRAHCTLASHLPAAPTPAGSEGRKTAAATRAPESEEDDGMEAMDSEILRLRFAKDHRVAEVRRLLQSSQPVQIAITQRPEVSDHEFIEEQERYLYAICTRTMALPLGRGMFTLRTAAPVVTEVLPIPRLCLTGRALPRGTTVDLTHIEVVPKMNLWPLFHNGVAAGLRIVPSASDIESAWIVFNKPKGTNEECTEHAGFLMALGLNGHLDNLARWNAYEYLVRCQEMTSVGLLLGIAATKRGTMDVATTKMLSLHLEALLPPTSIELDIQQNIQVAALLGVGLVYQGTAHRRMAEVLLSEIGRPPGPEMENSVDRESYSLAAGLALGLVVLGRGSQLCGLSDLAIPDMLHFYMVGGHRRPFTGSQKEKYKSPSYQIREGDAVNIDVTSPGATLALGMMFFNTKNRAVADWMKASDTQYLLDFVRPDFLLLRMVSRALILWDDIVPTSDWVEANIPDTIRPYCLVKPRPGMPDNVDYETMNQAYCNILAGACMALGLRFAGSHNAEAFDTLFKYAKMFTSLSGKSIAELAGKSTIETCLSVILLSLAMVMAGLGELAVLRLCRRLRARVGPSNSVVTYGSHLATHMSLGLLFLGGGRYTLSTSPQAVAAMVCAFFPKFPTHSNDNRYHLQAFRHLYVLAVEPRLLLPRDIDTGHLCYAHLRIVFLDTPMYQSQEVRLVAPCILPELSRLKQVTVEDDRYWTIDFHRNSNWTQLQSLLQSSGCVDVKQRAGCLSYVEDPQGFRSLLARTLTCDTAVSWSVRAESIGAFSSDPGMVNFARYFLERDGCESSEGELERMQMLTMLAYECVTQDKLAILPIWITLLKALQSLGSSPCVFLTWQLKLVTAQVLSANIVLGSEAPELPLVSPDLALSLLQHVSCVLESWEPDLLPILCRYMTGLPFGTDGVHQLATYITFQDVPPPQKLVPILTGDLDPLSLHVNLANLNLSASALRKLSFLLKASRASQGELSLA